MCIHRGNPAHRKVGNILEIDIVFINLKFLFLQEVKIEQLSLFLVINTIMLDTFIVIIFGSHLVIIFDRILHDVSTGYPNISEVIDRYIIIASHYRILNKIYLVLVLRYLNVVAEFIELLLETLQFLYLL